VAGRRSAPASVGSQNQLHKPPANERVEHSSERSAGHEADDSATGATAHDRSNTLTDQTSTKPATATLSAHQVIKCPRVESSFGDGPVALPTAAGSARRTSGVTATDEPLPDSGMRRANRSNPPDVPRSLVPSYPERSVTRCGPPGGPVRARSPASIGPRSSGRSPPHSDCGPASGSRFTFSQRQVTTRDQRPHGQLASNRNAPVAR
jgi:hypothetical protein